MTVTNDAGVLDPASEEFRLSSGAVVVIERLRTRQFFRLLKVLTRGAGSMLADYRLEADLEAEEFVGRLLALTVLSIPEAEDEALDFLRSMVKPVGLIERQPLSSGDRERNSALWQTVDAALVNPELEDTIDIIERIVRTEAGDIQALGKRLRKMFEVARKTGQTTPSATPSTTESTPTDSSAASLEPSISSPPSTAGPTTSSSTSPSAA